MHPPKIGNRLVVGPQPSHQFWVGIPSPADATTTPGSCTGTGIASASRAGPSPAVPSSPTAARETQLRHLQLVHECRADATCVRGGMNPSKVTGNIVTLLPRLPVMSPGF